MNLHTLTVITLSLASLALSSPVFAGAPAPQASEDAPAGAEPADFNRDIYYRNKLEFGFDAGLLDNNIPFLFNTLIGDSWDRPRGAPDYTMVPLSLSLRWHLDDIGGPWILRGNTDVTFSGNYTAIPRGPESYYASFMLGGRYNFVQPNWRIAPFLEGRVGCGFTDAKGPQGVQYAQGQDFAFTFTLGGGARYNFNPRYSVSAGVAYMHISNLYLSKDAYNYGINVFGPTVGVNIAF